ncbi:MAG: hypothetical protein JOZ75_11040 [Candidatus Dormibacteraeota bacterium]|nr:hypothetical protein [Candidatus Dormibacteraeota bacterium]
MKQVLGTVIGVPAAALVAGGLGLVGSTLWARYGGFLTQRNGEPIRWGSLWFGVGLFVVGAAAIWGDIVLLGPG